MGSPRFLSMHDEGRDFRSLEYRDNDKVNKNKNLRPSRIAHFGTGFAVGNFSASRQPYWQSGKRKPEIRREATERHDRTLDNA